MMASSAVYWRNYYPLLFQYINKSCDDIALDTAFCINCYDIALITLFGLEQDAGFWSD